MEMYFTLGEDGRGFTYLNGDAVRAFLAFACSDDIGDELQN